MSDDNNQEDGKYTYLSYGISFGLLGGVIAASILTLFFETPLIWGIAPGIGLLIGTIIGALIDYQKNEDQ